MFRFASPPILLLATALCCVHCCAEEPAARIAVQIVPDKPNTIDFDPVNSRFVRIVIRAAYVAAPCIDELEVYSDDKTTNLAAATAGAAPSASSCIPGFPIHAVPHLVDGKYGNDHSWIPAALPCWCQVELPKPARISRVVFSRDRNGHYKDRLPADFDVQVSTDGKTWTTIRHVTGLTEFPADAVLPGESPASRAVRIAHSLPGIYRERALPLATGVGGSEEPRRCTGNLPALLRAEASDRPHPHPIQARCDPPRRCRLGRHVRQRLPDAGRF